MLKKLFPNLTIALSLGLLLASASWVIFPSKNPQAASAKGNVKQTQNDLQNLLHHYDLLKLNTNDTFAQVRKDGKLTLPMHGKDVEITLQAHDLRAANYRAEATAADGKNHSLPKDLVVTTFKGVISGDTQSNVRLSLTETKVEGYFSLDGKRFFIEPAKRFSKSAEDDDFVIYRAEDLTQNLDFHCDADLPSKIDLTATKYLTNSPATQPLQIHTIATEADYEYVTLLGGATQANTEILGILNMVEGVYETELNLRFSVSFQHAWITPDPFVGNSTNDAFLSSFRDYWNTNFPVSQIPRNAAHLWTNKPAFSGTNARGTAYVGVVCQNQSAAYSLTGRRNEDFAFSINYLLAAHEIGHTFGASHLEAADSCGSTIMNAIVSNVTPLTFCSTSRQQIQTYVTQNSACLPQVSTRKTNSDFDGDGKSDIAVYRPSNGFWYAINSGNSSVSVNAFGISTDKIVPADYDGDGKTDIAVYRPSSGTWYVLKSSGGVSINSFGTLEDKPVPADYDNDGKADIAVYRPSSGIWYRLYSTNGAVGIDRFGIAEDKPVQADFDGDGKADLAVYRPSNGYWYWLNSSNGGFRFVGFGISTDIPNVGDFDGDGKADISVYRPSNGTWYRLNSANNAVTILNFGSSEDLPTSSASVR